MNTSERISIAAKTILQWANNVGLNGQLRFALDTIVTDTCDVPKETLVCIYTPHEEQPNAADQMLLEIVHKVFAQNFAGGMGEYGEGWLSGSDYAFWVPVESTRQMEHLKSVLGLGEHIHTDA